MARHGMYETSGNVYCWQASGGGACIYIAQTPAALDVWCPIKAFLQPDILLLRVSTFLVCETTKSSSKGALLVNPTTGDHRGHSGW